MRGKVVNEEYNTCVTVDHPRACGEKSSAVRMGSPRKGSPPRMRGKEPALKRQYSLPGITPAHAGKRQLFAHYQRQKQDHPRACGEKYLIIQWNCIQVGSPPRMRGKVEQPIRPDVHAGITPAHAGKSAVNAGQAAYCRDHPRACGEKMLQSPKMCLVVGSPPRMRGKDTLNRNYAAYTRITPAHAGKSF